MTTYVASGVYHFSGTENASLCVKAGAYELKIARIEVVTYGAVEMGFGGNLITSRSVGASLSGGSSLTPVPMRQGSPDASATARFGAVSVSGTTTFLSQQWIANTSLVGYEFPFDLTVYPGSAAVVTLAPNGTDSSGNPVVTSVLLTVYFEELRLSWHY